MTADTQIDWHHIGGVIRSVAGECQARHLGSSTQLACAAIEYLIGVERIAASVDHYVNDGAESELVRSVLWHLRPWSAMQRCYRIYCSAAAIRERRSSVELLRVVADRRALPWVPEFLKDPDAAIQVWGIGVLDQLLWSELVEPEQCGDLLEIAERHANDGVRESAAFIREFLADRTAG